MVARESDGFEVFYLLHSTDDDFDKSRVVIEYPYLKLDPVSEVILGDELLVVGETNRQDGTVFNIIVEGPGINETMLSEVSDGKISATFNTTAWIEGFDYIATVEDISKSVSQKLKFDVVEKVPKINITLDVSKTEANVSDCVVVRVNLTNIGIKREGKKKVLIMIDGGEVKLEDITLNPLESETVEYAFDITEDMVGTHTIEACGQNITLTVNKPVVEETPTSTPPPVSLAPTQTPTEEEPGFEAVFTVTGLLTVAYLVLKRKIK